MSSHKISNEKHMLRPISTSHAKIDRKNPLLRAAMRGQIALFL